MSEQKKYVAIHNVNRGEYLYTLRGEAEPFSLEELDEMLIKEGWILEEISVFEVQEVRVERSRLKIVEDD